MTEYIYHCIRCEKDFTSDIHPDDMDSENPECLCEKCARIEEMATRISTFFREKKDKVLVTNFVNSLFSQGKISKKMADEWIAKIWD